MARTTQSTLIGVFHDADRAREAVRALRQAGFTENQIGVVTRRGEGDGTMTNPDEASSAATGAATGAGVGAGVAALWSLGVTFGFIPVIGPILAAGPLAAALISAAGGAAAGGLVGALIGTGISEEDAPYYEGEFQSGRTLVTVKANNRSDEAWSILQQHGAYNRQTAASGTATAGTSSYGKTTQPSTAGGQSMQLHEEQLHARKDKVTTGEVRVRKEVVSEEKSLNVPVAREEVVVERHPASGRASASDIRAGEEIRIPVKEERVRVEKTPVVKEEVTVGKRTVQDNQKVSGTVRKEELRVEEKGNANVRGDEKSKSRSKT